MVTALSETSVLGFFSDQLFKCLGIRVVFIVSFCSFLGLFFGQLEVVFLKVVDGQVLILQFCFNF